MLLPLPVGRTASTSEWLSPDNTSDCPGLNPGNPNFSDSNAPYTSRSMEGLAPVVPEIPVVKVRSYFGERLAGSGSGRIESGTVPVGVSQ